jgi:hypothetical protein
LIGSTERLREDLVHFDHQTDSIVGIHLSEEKIVGSVRLIVIAEDAPRQVSLFRYL